MGRVKRGSFYKYLPLITKNIGLFTFPIIRIFLRRWLSKYKKICYREATKIVQQMLDYHDSGYLIVGIIATNDSPTCGFTKTINLLDIL